MIFNAMRRRSECSGQVGDHQGWLITQIPDAVVASRPEYFPVFLRTPHGPSDAQPLPLSYDECEDLKHGGVLHILAWYARSVACLGYLIEEHPSFDDYAR